jgi:hypothetical protein
MGCSSGAPGLPPDATYRAVAGGQLKPAVRLGVSGISMPGTPSFPQVYAQSSAGTSEFIDYLTGQESVVAHVN